MGAAGMRAAVGKNALTSLPGWVHPVLWDQPGVADAVRAVEKARETPKRIREERRKAHWEWRQKIGKVAGKPGVERPVEPPPTLSHEEQVALDAQTRLREAELGAVLESISGEVLASASEREVKLLEEARGHVEALEALVDEVRSLGRAVNVAMSAAGRGQRRQPAPSVEDLIWLVGKGEDVALLDFADPGDGRTRWLEATGRGRA